MSNIIEELFYGNLEPQYIAKRISEECNRSNKPVTIDDVPLYDIEAAFNGEKSAMEQCSNTSDIVPPKTNNPKLLPIGEGFGFFVWI